MPICQDIRTSIHKYVYMSKHTGIYHCLLSENYFEQLKQYSYLYCQILKPKLWYNIALQIHNHWTIFWIVLPSLLGDYRLSRRLIQNILGFVRKNSSIIHCIVALTLVSFGEVNPFSLNNPNSNPVLAPQHLSQIWLLQRRCKSKAEHQATLECYAET